MNRPARFACVLVAVICWLGAAKGHEDQAFHLANAHFCVDPASVQVVLDLPSPRRTVSARKVLKRELPKMLEATLSRSGASYRTLDRCTDRRDYLLLVAEIRYLDPKTYLGFGKQAYNYNLFLQVGDFEDAASLRLSTDRYNAFSSEIYAEGEGGRPFEPFVVGEASKLVLALTGYWWEDNPRWSLRLTLLPPLLGTLLALLSGAGVWWALHRRGAGRRSGYGSSG